MLAVSIIGLVLLLGFSIAPAGARAMRYWCFQDWFGLDNLVALQRETPQPGPGEVLLEISAASLNYRDLVVMRGEHGKSVQPPLIPLSDGVGTVVAVGKGVADFDIGDRKSPLFLQHWMGGAPPANLEAGRLGGPLDVVLASHCIFPAAGLIKPSDHLSDAQAATLPCAGVTAWSTLSEPEPLRPGETVLIQGSADCPRRRRRGRPQCHAFLGTRRARGD